MAVTIESGGLTFVVDADTSTFDLQMKRINAKLDELARNSQVQGQRVENQLRSIGTEGANLENIFRKASTTLVAFFSAQQAASFAQSVIRVRGEFQQLEIAFKTMLGSKEKADQLMQEAVKLAATTPFDLQQVAQGAKQLLAYGFQAEQVTETVRRLGDIASGVSAPLGDIVYLYGTLKASGRVTQLDINQFAGRGIPIYEELAKVMGVTTDKVRDFVSKGKVGFPQIEEAFVNLTSEGGKFNNLMAESSKSLTGQIANLGDAWDTMLNQIGQGTEGIASSGISALTSLVENYDKVLATLATLIATYGAYKTAVLVLTELEKGYTIVQQLEIAGLVAKEAILKLVKIQQLGVNSAVLANPYVLAFTALTTLVTAMWAFSDSTTDAEKAQKAINERLEEANKEYDKLKNSVSSYIAVIQDKNALESDQVNAYEALKLIFPDITKSLSLYEIQALSAGEVQNRLSNSLAKVKELGVINEYQALQEELRKAKKSYEEFSKNLGNQDPATRSQKDLVEKLNGQLEILAPLAEEASEKMFLLGATKSEKLDYFNNKLQKVNDSINQIQNQFAKEPSSLFVFGVTDQIDKLNAKLNGNPSANLFFGISGQLAGLQKQASFLNDTISQINGTNKSVSVVKNKAYYEGEAKKAKEEYESLDKSKLGNQQAKDLLKRIQDNERAASAYDTSLSKSTKNTVKSTQDLAKEREKLEQKRLSLLQKLNEFDYSDEARAVESIKQQYADLRSELEQFNKEAKLKGLKTFGTETFARLDRNRATDIADEINKKHVDARTKELDLLKTQYADFENSRLKLGEEKAQELADKNLDITKSYLTQLEIEYNKYDQDGGASLTKSQKEYKEELAKRIREEKQQQASKYVDLLAETMTFDQKRTLIEEQFNDKILQIKRAYSGKSQEELKNALKINDEAYRKAIQDLEKANFDKVDIFKNIKFDVKNATSKKVKEAVKKLKDDFYEKLSSGKISGQNATDRWKIIVDFEESSMKTVEQASIQKLSSIFQTAGQISETISNWNNGASQFGGLLSGAASQAQNLLTALDKNATPLQKSLAGVQGMITLLDVVISSAEQRREAERKFYQDVTEWQKQYNVALNDEILLRGEKNAGYFDDTRLAKLKSGIEALQDANNKFNNQLGQIQNARIKVSQKNGLDGKTIGKSVGAGAAAGAAVGTFLPVVGNVIGAGVGAIIGGIVGLFGGKKKVDVFDKLLNQYPKLITTGEDGIQKLDESLAKSLVNSNRLDEQSKSILQSAIDYQGQIQKAQDQVKQSIIDITGQLGDKARNALAQYFNDGSDAAQIFHNNVKDILKDLIVQKAYEVALKPIFDSFQTQLTADLQNSNGNNEDDIFTKNLTKLMDSVDKGIGVAQGIVDKGASLIKDRYGKDVTQKYDSSTSSGGVIGRSITEDTGTAIVGAMYGVQSGVNKLVLNQEEVYKNAVESQAIYRMQAEFLSNIEKYTKRTADSNDSINDKLDVLQDIKKELKSNSTALSNIARSRGL